MGEAAVKLGVEARAAIDTERQPATTGPAFTLRDAGDLEIFFRHALPPAYGASSMFGAMCQRIGEATNPQTLEKPSSNVVDWMHVNPSGGHGDPSVVEDSMIRYIEVRGRHSRAHKVLERLPQVHVDVLEARYAAPAPTTEHLSARQRFGSYWEVAQLGRMAAAIRAELEPDAQTEHSFTRRDALVRCVHLANSKTHGHARAKVLLRDAHKEAMGDVAVAEAAYARMALWVRR